MVVSQEHLEPSVSLGMLGKGHVRLGRRRYGECVRKQGCRETGGRGDGGRSGSDVLAGSISTIPAEHLHRGISRVYLPSYEKSEASVERGEWATPVEEDAPDSPLLNSA